MSLNWRQLKATSGQGSRSPRTAQRPRLINGAAGPGAARGTGTGLAISGAAINKAAQGWRGEVTHPAGTQRGLCSALPAGPVSARGEQRVPGLR